MAKPTANSELAKPDVEAIKATLRALKSPKKKKAEERQAIFAALYPEIRDQLNDDVSVRQILDAISPLLPLTYEIFKELLAAEAARCGEPVPGQADGTDAAIASTEQAKADQPKQSTQLGQIAGKGGVA